MTNTATTYVHEFSRPDERRELAPIETHEIRYRDLTGDGVPDAVERIDRRSFRRRGSDLRDTVEENRRLSYGIGIDGKPAGVVERTTLFIRDSAGRLREVAHSDK